MRYDAPETFQESVTGVPEETEVEDAVKPLICGFGPVGTVDAV